MCVWFWVHMFQCSGIVWWELIPVEILFILGPVQQLYSRKHQAVYLVSFHLTVWVVPQNSVTPPWWSLGEHYNDDLQYVHTYKNFISSVKGWVFPSIRIFGCQSEIYIYFGGYIITWSCLCRHIVFRYKMSCLKISLYQVSEY